MPIQQPSCSSGSKTAVSLNRLPKRDDYSDCANFSKSDHLTEENLLIVRGIFCFALACNVVTTYWLNYDGFYHMFFFFSYWGSILTTLGILFSTKAVVNKNEFQMWACLCTEMGMGFNFVIMPMFWIALWPNLVTLNWHGLDLITNIHLITTHTLPVIGGGLNIYLTKDFVFLPRDCKLLFILGILYIPANYWGFIYEGQPEYPVADWKNFWETVAWYVLLAASETVIYYLFSSWLCRKRGYKLN